MTKTRFLVVWKKEYFVNKKATMKNLVVTEEFWKEGNMYTAYCPELDVASCGRDVEEARKISLRLSKFNSKKQHRLEHSTHFYR